MFSQLGTLQGMWDWYSASRRRQGVRRIQHTSFLLVLKRASSPKCASAGGQGKRLDGNRGCSWENHLSVLLLGEREKKNLFGLGQKKWETCSISDMGYMGNSFQSRKFGDIWIVDGRETTKEYLSFNKLAINFSLSSRKSQSSLPILFFVGTFSQCPNLLGIFSSDFFETICN